MDDARSVHTNMAGLGTDATFPHPPLDAEKHNILPLEGYKALRGCAFNGDHVNHVDWETEVCTPPGIMLREFWELSSMPRLS